MKKVITARDVELILASGGTIPADALLTPSAKDALRDRGKSVLPAAAKAAAPAKKAEPTIPDHEFRWTPGSDPKTPAEIEAFFCSPEVERVKAHMCNVGRRIWEKDYVDGNGGNITVRVGDNLVLCTPTLISKGFMKPEDIALVDLDGNQVAGRLKRTSECMTHLAIMKATPKAKSCVHAHPPHATAFAIVGVRPPTCLIPEAEVFLGQIGLAPYETPGSPENAKAVGAIAAEHQSIIMQNHGVIVWGKDVEDAYWKMENTDAYCKTVWIASQLGAGFTQIANSKMKDLIGIRQKLGMDDYRAKWKECELCDNSDFRPGVVCVASAPSEEKEAPLNTDAEKVVEQITELVLKQLKNS